jgi:hypothetical protein
MERANKQSPVHLVVLCPLEHTPFHSQKVMREVGGVWCGLHAKGSDSIELELHHYCELVDNCHDNGTKFEQEQHS